LRWSAGFGSPCDTDLYLAEMLARAFDRAWERFYLDERGTISKEIARTSLAKHLVTTANEGEKDERALAASGFLLLVSLTEPPPRSTASPKFFHLRINHAQAKFLPEWRVVMGKSGGPRVRSAIAHFRIDNAKAQFLRQWRKSVSAISFSNLTFS
jgi:hypothetical protein